MIGIRFRTPAHCGGNSPKPLRNQQVAGSKPAVGSVKCPFGSGCCAARGALVGPALEALQRRFGSSGGGRRWMRRQDDGYRGQSKHCDRGPRPTCRLVCAEIARFATLIEIEALVPLMPSIGTLLREWRQARRSRDAFHFALTVGPRSGSLRPGPRSPRCSAGRSIRCREAIASRRRC
jgi:hypothetical protein